MTKSYSGASLCWLAARSLRSLRRKPDLHNPASLAHGILCVSSHLGQTESRLRLRSRWGCSSTLRKAMPLSS